MRSSPLFLLVLFLSHSGPGNGDTGRRRVVFDPAHFGVQRTMFPELGRIHAVDISDNGKYLVSGGQNGGISVIRTSDWSLSWKGSYPLGSITSIAFCPRSEIFAVAGSTSGLIYLVNAKSRTDFRILEGEGFPLHDLAWFPDGKRLVSAVGTGAVRIWNAKTGQTERVLRVHRGAVYTLALNRFHLVTGGADGAVRIYDTAEWKEVGGIQNPGLAVKHLRLTRDGKTLYGTTQGAITSLRAWDLASGKILESKVVAPGKSVSGIQMDATGRYLVLAVGTDLQVWSRFPLKLVETCRYHRVAIEALEYSGRTGWMVVGGGDSHVTIWGRVRGGMSSVPPRGFFGVRVQDAGNDLGATVSAVIGDTAASRAGIQANDIITRVGNFSVRDTATTIAAIGIHSEKARVSFTILRGQETLTLTVTLGKRPEGMD